MLVQFDIRGEKEKAVDKIEPVLDAVADAQRAHPGFVIGEFGDASAENGVETAYAEDLGKAGELSLPITLIILVLTFGALVAAGIPLLLGLTAVRYDPATGPAEIRAITDKLRKAIETEGRRGLIEGLWWQLSLTVRSEEEPSAVSLLRVSRDRDGDLTVNGRAWQEDGTLSARYWSEAAKERRDPAGIFYCWKGERPRHPNAPELEGTGEIRVETADRATGYWVTRSDRDPGLNARTAGIYLRADPADFDVLDAGSEGERSELIARRLAEWKSAANAF